VASDLTGFGPVSRRRYGAGERGQIVIAITASIYRQCDLSRMKNVEHSSAYSARIREFEVLAADTEDLEMVAILRRLALAYREVARSEVCGRSNRRRRRDGGETAGRRTAGADSEQTQPLTQA
jgi:hypothetical protein